MHSTFFSRVPCTLVLAMLTFGSTFAGPASAQWWADDSKPANSSYWWTLSDSITPQQLRTALTDVGQHQLRFVTDSQSLSNVAVSSITVYIDGSTSPELIPMWRAFSAFAHRFEDWSEWDSVVTDSLKSYGLSKAGALSILSSAASLNSSESTLKASIWPQSQAFTALVRDAGRAMGDVEAGQQLVDAGDFSTLASLTGRSVKELQMMYRHASRSPMAEAAPLVLEALVQELSNTDWQRLRAYLLAEVAPGISVRDLETVGAGAL